MRREDRAFNRTGSIVLKGELIDFNTPLVMGIINLDPESFYSGSRSKGIKDSLDRVSSMIHEGADIVDIGAASSRPGAAIIEPDQEWARLKDVLIEIRKAFPNIPISIDTPHWTVAAQSIQEGADLINDISGGEADADMIPQMGKTDIPYICMHMKGTPSTMQSEAHYKDVVTEVIAYLHEKMIRCRESGIKSLILDPGFGFAKNSSQNFNLLKELSHVKSLACPLLIGVSRKRMVYGSLDISPEEALNGTTALHMAALERGANILRVHDVKEARECIKLFSLLHGKS